jgi:hypothetical protein
MRTFDSSTAVCLLGQGHCSVKLRSEAVTALKVRMLLVLIATWSAFGGTLAADNIMIQEDNMKELNCSLPNEQYRLLRTNAPGQVFVGDEKVNLTLAFKKGNSAGRVSFSIEIQEIGTRTPGKVVSGMTGWTDTSGKAPRFDVIGEPVTHDFAVDFRSNEVTFELQNLPVPQRFGTYALIVVRGSDRRFLGTLARVPVPRPDGTIETVPIPVEGEGLCTHGHQRLASGRKLECKKGRKPQLGKV